MNLGVRSVATENITLTNNGLVPSSSTCGLIGEAERIKCGKNQEYKLA